MRSAIPPPSLRRPLSLLAAEAVERCGPVATDRLIKIRSELTLVSASLHIAGPRLIESNPSGTPSLARTSAERLVARAVPARATPEEAVTGAEVLFTRLFHNLSQWVGNAGCQALFSRAFLLCTNPACADVRFHMRDRVPHLDRLAENARLCGGEATVEGVTEVVTAIVTMLIGLIGDEKIAVGLLEDGPPTPHHAAARMPADGPPSYKADGLDKSDGVAAGRASAIDRRCGHDRRHS